VRTWRSSCNLTIQAEAASRLGLFQVLGLGRKGYSVRNMATTKDSPMLYRPVQKHARNLLLATICCALVGCATTAKYEDSLDLWKGRSDSDLIKSWGKPSETFNSNGHTFLVYQFSRTQPFLHGGDPTGSPATYMSSFFCTTIFDVSSGQVIDWAIKGNDCKDVNQPILWKTAF
jgi:hypothetical protein